MGMNEWTERLEDWPEGVALEICPVCKEENEYEDDTVIDVERRYCKNGHHFEAHVERVPRAYERLEDLTKEDLEFMSDEV